MCFLALLYIWESMRSLKSKCIRIQTLIKVFAFDFKPYNTLPL
jgi:hypothetical protein